MTRDGKEGGGVRGDEWTGVEVEMRVETERWDARCGWRAVRLLHGGLVVQVGGRVEVGGRVKEGARRWRQPVVSASIPRVKEGLEIILVKRMYDRSYDLKALYSTGGGRREANYGMEGQWATDGSPV